MAWSHHLLVHLPVALSVLVLGVAIVALARADARRRQLTRCLLYVAMFSALVSMATGLGSSGPFVQSGGDASVLAGHRNAGLLSAGVLNAASAVGWLTRHSPSRLYDLTLALLLLVAAAAAAIAAHRAGAMLHEGLEPPWASQSEHHAHTYDNEAD